MRNDKAAAEYASKRLGNSFGKGNDRLSRDKQWADAALRGKLGTDAANKLIGAMDEIKYGVNSYRDRY
jgi:hypothetical protein